MVVLRTLKLNRLIPVGSPPWQPTAGEPGYYPAPAGPRRVRVTDRLRADVVSRYQAGETSRVVAEETGASKATVLKILAEAGVQIRPTGAHY